MTYGDWRVMRRVPKRKRWDEYEQERRRRLWEAKKRDQQLARELADGNK